MSYHIGPCGFEDIEGNMKEAFEGLASPFDSFLEDHILASRHYRITKDGEAAGWCSIRKETLLTQFHLQKEHLHLGQEIFERVKRQEQVKEALVYTGDECFLAHALEKARKIDFQAYFFKDSERPIDPDKVIPGFNCRPVVKGEAGFVREKTGDFFDKIEERIENGELFAGEIGGETVSYGIAEPSRLCGAVASIGMITLPEHRGKGIGRNTILKMKRLCLERGVTPIAGCWYYNHNSKKTLESAGMYTETRLLAIEF